MGVVDQEYVSRTGDRDVVVGRRVVVEADEIQRLALLLRSGAESISNQFKGLANDLERSG